MSRKRFITSEISVDEKLAEVAQTDPVAALMWPWFCTALDDWGRMSAGAAKVKLDVFPGFSFTAGDIAKAMHLYHEVGLVVLYEIDDHQYMQANPAVFYRLNTYIQKPRQYKDSSKLPPPNHPWADYWAESVWRNTKPQKATLGGEKLQEAAKSVLSPSPSPSQRSLDPRGGSQEAAREAIPEPETPAAGENNLAADIESALPPYLGRLPSGGDCQEVARWVADGATRDMFPGVLDRGIAEFRRRNGEGKCPRNARWFAGAVYAELGRRAGAGDRRAGISARDSPAPVYPDMADVLRSQGVNVSPQDFTDEEDLF